MRRVLVAVLLVGATLLVGVGQAAASVLVEVVRATQTMDVSVDGAHLYSFAVSTGRAGWPTPPGTFHPQFLAARWYSRAFHNAPMPHSIFYSGPFAIHGTTDVGRLGRPASHGCIRLHPNDAAALFDLVERQGLRNTTIVVQ